MPNLRRVYKPHPKSKYGRLLKRRKFHLFLRAARIKRLHEKATTIVAATQTTKNNNITDHIIPVTADKATDSESELLALRAPLSTPVRSTVPLTPPPQAWIYRLAAGSLTAPIGIIQLDPFVWRADTSRRDILHRYVCWQLANLRQGTHSTRTRAENHRTTKKPFNQKGTGQARQGSLKGPHQRKGGVAHGPKPRDWSQDLPVKIRQLAQRICLSTKYEEGSVLFIDEAKAVGNFQSVASSVRQLLLDGGMGVSDSNVLLIHGKHEVDGNLQLAARAIKELHIQPANAVSLVMMMQSSHVIISATALNELQSTLKPRNNIKLNVGSEGVRRLIRFSKSQMYQHRRRSALMKRIMQERNPAPAMPTQLFSPSPHVESFIQQQQNP